ncbi:hypothetical protein BJX62DRAFT_205743 [Aspergillus germanicus]
MNRMFYIHWGREQSTGFSLPYYEAAVHILPFTDHTGDITRPGYMVFRNYSVIPLPPLFPFIIYFTNSQTLPDSIDLRGLYLALKMKVDEVHPRLDVYFLPGATEMDCLVHYQREQVARGCYRAQIDAFEDYSSRHFSKFHLAPQPPRPGRLPDMSTRYCLEYEHYQVRCLSVRRGIGEMVSKACSACSLIPRICQKDILPSRTSRSLMKKLQSRKRMYRTRMHSTYHLSLATRGL